MSALSAELAAALIEAGKIGIQFWFLSQRMQGKSDDEIDEALRVEHAKFNARSADKLPEV